MQETAGTGGDASARGAVGGMVMALDAPPASALPCGGGGKRTADASDYSEVQCKRHCSAAVQGGEPLRPEPPLVAPLTAQGPATVIRRFSSFLASPFFLPPRAVPAAGACGVPGGPGAV